MCLPLGCVFLSSPLSVERFASVTLGITSAGQTLLECDADPHSLMP
jgi:hypothetical protein